LKLCPPLLPTGKKRQLLKWIKLGIYLHFTFFFIAVWGLPSFPAR
jgi:hypothetical protein